MNARIRVNKIKSIKEGYDECLIGGYFYQYGRWQEQYVWLRNYKQPTIENKYTGEIIRGLKNINKLMELKNLELEAY